MTQLTLDDIDLGIQGREDGMARAEAHADEGWKEAAMQAIYLTAVREPYFTSAVVWDLIDGSTHEPRVMGALMRQACKAGWITPTDQFAASTRPSQHRQPLRVWRSRICGG